MNVRPLKTVPLRARLRLAGRRNAFNRARPEALTQKYVSRVLSDVPAFGNMSLSSVIHPYPGIGHQLAGWISGQLWARDLGLDYGGGEVTRDEHELFDFSAFTPGADAKSGKVVRLVSVNDERDPRSLQILQGQIRQTVSDSHGSPIRFRLALDQCRWDQTPAEGAVRGAVLDGSYGSILRSIEVERPPYIAFHVRRGDVSEGAVGGSTGKSRWIDEKWYLEVLRHLQCNSNLKDLEICAYALGEPEDFPLLRREGVNLKLNRDRDMDFVELCGARVLVAAPSSFSFTAALASRGVVVARSPWWHHVPDGGRWVRADGEGALSKFALDRALDHTLNPLID